MEHLDEFRHMLSSIRLNLTIAYSLLIPAKRIILQIYPDPAPGGYKGEYHQARTYSCLLS